MSSSSASSSGIEREPLIITRGALPKQWIHGDTAEPLIQAHCLLEEGPCSSWVFRFSQSLGHERADLELFDDAYEGNFVFLFVGSERAILFDTGPVDISVSPLRFAIEVAVPKSADLELVVAHTHDHGDHVAGDGIALACDDLFRSVVSVGHSAQEVEAFFCGLRFPDSDPVSYSLGDRALEIFPIPGHRDSHICIYDRFAHVLITGDVLYPGRLYVNHDALDFAASARRIANFVQKLPQLPEPLRVLGCHIEMTSTLDIDYPTGTIYQPDEATYELYAEDVQKLADHTARYLQEPGFHKQLLLGKFAVVGMPSSGPSSPMPRL
jgi:glyoxylase-like metal-dependent hydrolase (beta-lactamase superfamily II)